MNFLFVIRIGSEKLNSTHSIQSDRWHKSNEIRRVRVCVFCLNRICSDVFAQAGIVFIGVGQDQSRADRARSDRIGSKQIRSDRSDRLELADRSSIWRVE